MFSVPVWKSPAPGTHPSSVMMGLSHIPSIYASFTSKPFPPPHFSPSTWSPRDRESLAGNECGGGGDVWFQQVSVGLSECGTREWTFSSLLLVSAQGKMGEFRLFWPRSEGENLVIGSPRRLASIGAKCAQFAAASSFHIATYTMYNRCASLSLLLCLRGGWSGADFQPVVCEQEGRRKTAPWLDDMLGDTLLNCFDRCAAKVTIKKPLSSKIYIMISSRLNIDVMYTMLCDDSMVCVCVALTAVSCKSHRTPLGKVRHVLWFVYHEWNEAVWSYILIKYASPSRLHEWAIARRCIFISSASKLGLPHIHFIDLQVFGNANKVFLKFFLDLALIKATFTVQWVVQYTLLNYALFTEMVGKMRGMRRMSRDRHRRE